MNPRFNRLQEKLRFIFLYFTINFVLLVSIGLPKVVAQSSLIVSLEQGELTYIPFAMEGRSNAVNVIPDFSHAGYQGGGVSLPVVHIVETLYPIEGDDGQNIQDAIDRVALLTVNNMGFRGTVLLKAGTYEVAGKLNINTNGIVIRGEGQGEDGTVLLANLTQQHDFINVKGTGSLAEQGATTQNITTSYVPVGTKSFDIADASSFNVGDLISVKRTPNQTWINDLGMDEITLCDGKTGCTGWTSSSYTIKHERQIEAISGNTITINIPIVDVMEAQYGGGVVSKASWNGRIQNCGIENLRIVSTFSSDTDENHVWSAVYLEKTLNCWVKNVTSLHAGFSCVDLLDAKYTTVQDCAYLEPKSQVTGSRRYSFVIQSGIGNLVQRCFAEEGRHDFALQSRVTGPNVFLDGLAVNPSNDIGPHQRWATGTLFDNIEGEQMRAWNRGNSGSGHGWAGAQTLFWNCISNGVDVNIENPPGAINWAIGTSGSLRKGNGYFESWNTAVLPRSLYLQQLEDRLGEQAVHNVTAVEQRNGTINSKLKQWDGVGSPNFSLGETKTELSYKYIVEEWNFTGGGILSEEGAEFSLIDAGTADTDGDGQLYVDRTDRFFTPISLPTITEGKVHVYITMAGFNTEMNPDNNGGGRYFGIRLQNSGSIVADVRLYSQIRDLGSGDVPAMRLGGAGTSTTTSSAGYPYAFATTDESITFGMTIDYSGGDNNTGSWKYWIGSPEDNGSSWAQGPFSGANGSKDAGASFDQVNELRLVIDHAGGGDTPLASNYFNLDRIMLVHESANAPSIVSLSAATKDNGVTISSNETTTISKRVQRLTVNSGATLTVAAGHELTVIDDLTINGNLLIKDGGSLKTFGTVTGSITKERTTTYGGTEGRYSIVGSPVQGATTDVLGGITYKYIESRDYGSGNQERFDLVTSAETMVAADGYFAANVGTASFVGTPNTGVITSPLVYNSSEGSNAGWNCVSNPYPGAIELKSLVTANPSITGSVYLWDDGNSQTSQRTNADYITVSASGTATLGSGRSGSFDGYIRSEQGFFVQASEAGNLTFSEFMKAGVSPNSDAGYFRKASNKQLLRIALSNEAMTSDMVLEVNPKASAGFDRLFDARRIKSGTEVNIYSYADDEELVIQGVSAEDLASETWLGVDIATAGHYELAFDYGLSDVVLYLHDHITERYVNLSEVSNYSFYSEGSLAGEKRFSISEISSVLALDEVLDGDQLNVFFHDDILNIRFGSALQDATLIVHDIQGRLLNSTSGINDESGIWSSKVNLKEGIYIIRLVNKNRTNSIKTLK